MTSMQSLFEKVVAPIDTLSLGEGENVVYPHISSIFKEVNIPELGVSSDSYQRQLEEICKQAARCWRPDFVGHMTSSLPAFVAPMMSLIGKLNQNIVKVETSGSLTAVEKQVVGMLHKLVYGESSTFYEMFVQSRESSLGWSCSGGTVGNLTGLWLARNRFTERNGFPGQNGSQAATNIFSGFAVLVSERAHYSLSKCADILGLGSKSVIKIAVDETGKIVMKLLEQVFADLQEKNVGVIAVVGIAGGTETGSIDPLMDLAQFCKSRQVHFHVDAAWGGALAFSNQHRHALRGIEEADSVVIDGHKQLYLPIGLGFILLKDPNSCKMLQSHAEYIIRSDSYDLGRFTVEGSRPANSLLLHAGFHLLGRQGFEMLVDRSVELAQIFRARVDASAEFEVMTSSTTSCIVTYRYNPWKREKFTDGEASTVLNLVSNETVQEIQNEMWKKGEQFVSRTSLSGIQVFRVVLANPATSEKHLVEILDLQRALALTVPSRKKWLELKINVLCE